MLKNKLKTGRIPGGLRVWDRVLESWIPLGNRLGSSRILNDMPKQGTLWKTMRGLMEQRVGEHGAGGKARIPESGELHWPEKGKLGILDAGVSG